MHGSGAVSCACSLLIRGPILPAVRQKLHLSPCADYRSPLSSVGVPPTTIVVITVLVLAFSTNTLSPSLVTYNNPSLSACSLLKLLREPRTILAFGSGCSARAEVSPRSGDRFDAWPASARSFARCHTESTRERTQAGAAAIRSS